MKKLIVLGQVPSKSKDLTKNFSDISSLKTLNKWLADAGVPASMVRLLNVIPDRVGKRHLNKRDKLRYGKQLKDTIKENRVSVVVCLGKLAEEVFYSSDLEKEGVLATFLPHPSSNKLTKDDETLAAHWLAIAYNNHILRERI